MNPNWHALSPKATHLLQPRRHHGQRTGNRRPIGRVAVAALLAVVATTAGAAPKRDTTAPTVAIAAPATGVTVQNAIAIAANATDNVGVVGVQFKLDNSNFGNEIQTPPFSVPWNTALSSNGTHTLIAVARDAAGNVKQSTPVSVIVANTPATVPCTPGSATGCRVLGLDVGPAEDGDYDAAFTLASNAGVQVVSLTFDWRSVETAPGVYDATYFDIADSYFPAHNMAVALSLRPISTNYSAVPGDLTRFPFDNRRVISRYEDFARFALAHLSHVALVSIDIGSESDVYLGSDPAAWAAFTRFYEAVGPVVRALRPGVPVGTELTFNGLLNEPQATLAATLNATSDGIWVSYMAVDDTFHAFAPTAVGPTFDAIAQRYSKPIAFTQIGYPSGGDAGSSEEMQRQFIAATFDAWDTHASRVPFVRFTWETDIDPALVLAYEDLYGVHDPAFASFLGTLGLRRWPGSGEDKPAWTELVQQAAARGW